MKEKIISINAGKNSKLHNCSLERGRKVHAKQLY